MGVDVIYDNLDTTGGGPIVVEANVRLLSESEGGKSRPITRNYRPNHNFGNAESRVMFIGQVELGENEYLHPGESRDVLVTFVNVRGLSEQLVVGAQWRLQEGMRLVGTAKLKRVVRA